MEYIERPKKVTRAEKQVLKPKNEQENTEKQFNNVYDKLDELVNIGNWVDGKTIYREVIKDTISNVAKRMNSIGIDTLISFTISAVSNFGNTHYIPTPFPDDSNYDFGIIIYKGNYDFQYGSNFSSTNQMTAILTYTKK